MVRLQIFLLPHSQAYGSHRLPEAQGFLCPNMCLDCVVLNRVAADSGVRSYTGFAVKCVGSASVIVFIIFLLVVGCSILMSCVAFLVGRCGRKLPVDGMLPRVVHSARFGPERDQPCAPSRSAEARWPHAS